MKKRRVKKNVKLIFYLVLVLVLFFFVKSFTLNDNTDSVKTNDENENTLKEENKVVKKSGYLDIIDYSESNTDIIKETFANGMSLSDFESVNTQEDNYVKSTGKYEMINFNFEYKLHYSKIEEYLNMLNNSSIVNLEIIGSSYDSRNIYSVEIGEGNKELVIDANIHAAETANTIILLKYMIDLVNNYESGDEDTINKLTNYKVVILPCINPDSYEVYNFGIESLNNRNLWLYLNKDDSNFTNFKCNANGVDLNRNMPVENAGLYYNKYSLIKSVSKEKTTSEKAYFGGESLGSENETHALMYFMLKHYKNAFAYINMHSQGRVIYQGKPNLSDEFNERCNKLAKYLSSYNKYTIYGISSEEVGQGNDGSATDFMAELANGFKFSTSSGRLAIKEYLGEVNMEYNYGVVTMETLNTYTDDPSVYKNEYYNYKFYDMFTNLLEDNSY